MSRKMYWKHPVGTATAGEISNPTPDPGCSSATALLIGFSAAALACFWTNRIFVRIPVDDEKSSLGDVKVG